MLESTPHMSPRPPADPPEGAPADAPAEEASAAPAPQRPSGPDRFQDGSGRRPPAFVMKPERHEAAPAPRARVLDPRLVPVVPPSVTTDPARQFHALLGLPRPPAPPPKPAPPPAPAAKPKPPPRPKAPAKAKPPPKPAPPPPEEDDELQAAPEIERILRTLPPARANIIRQVITGPESRLKRALRAFLEDPKYTRLDFEAQRRALAAFDLRY